MHLSTAPRLGSYAWPLLLAVVAFGGLVQPAAGDAEIDLIEDRMTYWASREPFSLSQDAIFYNTQLAANGQFLDNPSDTEAAKRFALLSQAWYGGSSLTGDAGLEARLHAGLDRWLDEYTLANNKGPDSFERPRYIGAAALLLQSPDGGVGMGPLHGRLATYLTTDPWLHTEVEQFKGANVTYRLDGMTAGAVLAGTAAEFDRINNALDVTFQVHGNTSRSDQGASADVGLMSDGAWLQHNAGGGQMYWIGYGRDWANGIRRTFDRFEDTQWQPTDAELNKVADGYLDGQQWMYFKGQGLHSVGGRHNLKPGAFENANSVASWFRDVAGFDANIVREQELLDAADRLDGSAPALTGNRHFYTADTTVHTRPDYYIGIRTSSVRTSGVESGNGDGLVNYHFGDGTALIYRDGDEYDNARAVWDYKALPGVTAARTPGQSLPLVNWANNTESSNTFSGGVSDGLHGVTAFKHDRDNDFTPIRLNKGYFLFEDEMVALGSLIRLKTPAASNQEVWTTINQTEMRSDVTYAIDGGTVQSIGQGVQSLSTLSVQGSAWFHQDGVGYLVTTDHPEGTSGVDVRLQTENRTGNWGDLNAAAGSNVSVDIFQLSIDHGFLDHADRLGYAYAVVPDVTAAEMEAYAADAPIEIVHNDWRAQAVRHEALGLEQVVFYREDYTSAIQLSEARSIASSDPIIAMLREESDTLTISVADPNRTLTDVTLTLSEQLTGEGAVWDALLGQTTIDFTLPSGIDTGATLTRSFARVLDVLLGDYNADGFVSQADLDLVLLNWGDAVVPTGFDEAAVPGGGPFDGLVSQNELDGVLLNWGNGAPPNVALIPEPGTAALSLVGAVLMRRRRTAHLR